MILIGYLVFLDLLKELIVFVIKNFYEYGVDVKIFIGDNVRVIKVICDKVGMKIDGVIFGKDLINLNDEEFREIVEKYNIFVKFSFD